MVDQVLEVRGCPVNSEGVIVLQAAVRLSDKNQILFSSQNKFTAGTQIRFVTWGSATGINIITESPSAGYTIAASRIVLTGTKTI